MNYNVGSTPLWKPGACILHVYRVWVPVCVLGAHRDRELDSLELDLQMVINHQMGVGNTLGPMQDQPVFLIFEASFQLHGLLLNLQC